MQISRPTVSVIMSVYNAESFLEDSIRSVLRQSFNDFEFIIIDDGSTDHSLQVMKPLAHTDARVKVISRNNTGLVKSLNEGIHISKGRYIARMDADDVCLPDRFDLQVRYLDMHPECAAVGTYIRAIGDVSYEEREQVEKWFNVPITESDMEELFLRKCCVAHPTVMMRRRELLALDGYDESFHCIEDYDLWLRFIENKYKVANIPVFGLEYRIHPGSKSKNDNLKQRDFETVYAKVRFLSRRFNSQSFKYVIWGAGSGGEMAHRVIQSALPGATCVAFIDKFKRGTFQNVLIMNPVELRNLQFDYAFIATAPGREQAEQCLSAYGYQPVTHFSWLV